MRAIARIVFASFLLALSGLAAGQWRNFADWYTGQQTGGAGPFAATVNDSGHVLGQYCFPASDACAYILGLLNKTCEKGSRYPLLANANTGSKNVEVYCNGPLNGGRYQYVFTEFDEIHRIVVQAERVGFAFPIAGD